MKCLFVIDMQEDYVGSERNRKIYPYDTTSLTANINKKTSEYPSENVFYITNKFFWEYRKKPKLINELLVVSNNFYVKKKTSCFSNVDLLNQLKKMNVHTIELVGVDGNYCVGRSAMEARKKGFHVLMDLSCVGIANTKKFQHTKDILKDLGVNFI
jgi:nicotinamidase-related amidase